MTGDGQQPDGDQPQESKLAKDTPEIKLSVPWGEGLTQSISSNILSGGNIRISDIDPELENSSGVHNRFIVERTRLHETYI
jgi:hypothetical protein